MTMTSARIAVAVCLVAVAGSPTGPKPGEPKQAWPTSVSPGHGTAQTVPALTVLWLRARSARPLDR